jgi:acyl carrier protein
MNSHSLKNYLGDRMGLDTGDLADDTPLFSSNLLDSFSMVDLIMFIEKESGVQLNATDVSLDNLDSIGRILRFVDTRRADA